MYTKEQISEMIKTDVGMMRGILAIYKYQTSYERAAGETVELNGVGFNGCDAEILSSFAERLLAKKLLTPKQMEIARKKMPKYAGQLTKIANLNQ